MTNRFKLSVLSLAGLAGLATLVATSSPARAGVFETYESLSEGDLGPTFAQNGVTYRDVNNVSGFYADGTPFGPLDNGNDLIIENATLFYNDFPTYGSPVNALTFGNAFIPGDNLSIGALASAWMDVAGGGNAASFDIAFYENGVWGGIQYHLDAVQNGNVVASDTFTISDLGGRDNATFRTMSVSGAQFDSLHLYATKNGDYTVPRGMIDNLSISSVPEPTSLALMGIGGIALIARRRRSI
jgi:hypothetical protein